MSNININPSGETFEIRVDAAVKISGIGSINGFYNATDLNVYYFTHGENDEVFLKVDFTKDTVFVGLELVLTAERLAERLREFMFTLPGETPPPISGIHDRYISEFGVELDAGVLRWTTVSAPPKVLNPQPPTFNRAAFIESDPLFGGFPSIANVAGHAQYASLGSVSGSQFSLVMVYHPNGNIDISRIMSLRDGFDANKEISPTVNGAILWGEGSLSPGITPLV